MANLRNNTEVLDDGSTECGVALDVMRLILLILCFSMSAHAQPVEAISAFVEGEFEVAAELAESEGSADGLAFAARSVLSDVMSNSGGNPQLADLQRAEALARRAMAAEEGHSEAQLQLAITLSLQSRPLSNGQALRSGLGQKAKQLAESILEAEPNNTYAHALLAVWNMEVLRRGGRLGARVMGASSRAAIEHYEAARIGMPDDGALHWQWARILAATNAKRYREHIDVALAAAIAANTDDALEATMQKRAAKFKQDMQALSTREIEELAASLL